MQQNHCQTANLLIGERFAQLLSANRSGMINTNKAANLTAFVRGYSTGLQPARCKSAKPRLIGTAMFDILF